MRKLLFLSLVVACTAVGLFSPSPASGGRPFPTDCVITCTFPNACGYVCCYERCCGDDCVILDCAPPPPCEGEN